MTRVDAGAYFDDLHELCADRSTPLDERIARAVAIGRERLGLGYGLLSVTATGECEIVESTAEAGPCAAGTTRDLSETWCRHAVEGRDLVAVADADGSAYSDDVARDTTGMEAYIGAPLVVHDVTYGTLSFADETARETPFTEDERRFVRLLARWLEFEIERDRRGETQNLRNEQLMEFAGMVAHDLRNPLTTAIGYTEIAMEAVDGDEAEHLETAMTALEQMEGLIADVLTLAREGAEVGEREPVSVRDVAERAWTAVDPERGRLTVTDDISVLADRARLYRLFETLFRNVVDHCGSDVTVTVRRTDDGFVVEDDGPGLPDTVTDSLFGDEFDIERRGLGLFIVERIVSGHGWTGAVETDADGTRFVFSDVDTE